MAIPAELFDEVVLMLPYLQLDPGHNSWVQSSTALDAPSLSRAPPTHFRHT